MRAIQRFHRLHKPLTNLCARAMSTSAGSYGSSLYTVDVHTHVYLPRYMDILRNRGKVPRVETINNEDRLIILPGEDAEESTSKGRPIGSEYYDMDRKIAFMDAHGIDVSVLSLANPWLDFLGPEEAPDVAKQLNADLNDACERSHGRFYGFGVLPTTNVEASCQELERIAKSSKLRGIILSTQGLGSGLDDEKLLPIFQTIERLGLFVFLHPHYGVGNESFGSGYGHALFLALGFTFETTTAVARLICSGTLDKVPDLKLLLAHAGGTLPFLAGRLDSCVEGDAVLKGKLKKRPTEYLKNMYYDSISYHTPTLSAAQQFVGTDRLMFGTDHPFFPPPAESYSSTASSDVKSHPMDSVEWPSTSKNIQVAEECKAEESSMILGENARRLLNLD
eukprot:gb/GECG01005970.1/.p1 GENE.gb/GECG01005970.1/~~gb/GECG01005970.1/.p1  ORF type:complete len:393 (+),score=46.10 gb/GECG01005970.1/:1-1179(+)